MEEKDIEKKGRLCAKCYKKAVFINGADIPVCEYHDMEDTPNKGLREAIQSMGYPV